MIPHYWVNWISLSEVDLAGDTKDVKGEIPHAASTAAPKCGEQHLNLKRHLPVLFRQKAGSYQNTVEAKKPDTRYLVESQVLNRSIMRQLAEAAIGPAKATGEKSGPRQRYHHMAKNSAGRGAHWGTLGAGAMLSSQAHTLLGSFVFKAPGRRDSLQRTRSRNLWTSRDLCISFIDQLVLFCLSYPTITASLSLQLQELLSPLY